MSTILKTEKSEDEIKKYLKQDGIVGYDDKASQIKFVEWGKSEISSERFPYLYSTGFSSCIALYLFNRKVKNTPYSFLYHVYTNRLDRDPNDFPHLPRLSERMLSELSTPILCDEEFQMGIVYGTRMLFNVIPLYLGLVEEGFNNLFDNLDRGGIKIVKGTPNYSSNAVLLDPKGKGLVLSSNAYVSGIHN